MLSLCEGKKKHHWWKNAAHLHGEKTQRIYTVKKSARIYTVNAFIQMRLTKIKGFFLIKNKYAILFLLNDHEKYVSIMRHKTIFT